MNRCIFLLDSGAFTVHQQGATVDIEKYAAFVAAQSPSFRGGAFNLDVIGSDAGSYENWCTLRRMGVETIPVHHVGDDVSYLKKYLDQCEYIGIGAIAKLDTVSRLIGLDHVWKEYLTLPDGTPRLRVHGLGLTDNSIVLRYPWYSVDSTRAVILASYGNILVPEFTPDGTPDFASVRQIGISDQARDHFRGKLDSFYGMPTLVRRRIVNYASSLNYKIEETITGRTLKQVMPSRKVKIPEWSDGLGIGELLEPEPYEEDSDKMRNLTLNWVARFGFNLIVIEGFIKYWAQRGHDVKMFNVCGNKSVLDHFLGLAPSNPSRCLLSYIKMSDGLLATVKQGVRGGSRPCEAS